MILKRLFVALFDMGLVLVSTSNRAPDALYEGGLQRDLFVPFIHLLKKRCSVFDIVGTMDYRMAAHKLSQPMFFTGATAHEDLEAMLHIYSGGKPVQPRTVEARPSALVPAATSTPFVGIADPGIGCGAAGAHGSGV